MKKLLSTVLFIALIISSMGLFVSAEGDAALPSDKLGATGHGVFTYCDVDPSSWYYDAVWFCHINGIYFATDTYTFEAEKLITRERFAQWLFRAIDADFSEMSELNTENFYFADCEYLSGSHTKRMIGWLAINGYMVGTGEKTFSPKGYITREQILTVFMRVMEKKGEDVTVPDSVLDGYVDKDEISDWALPAVKYAIDKGIIVGTSTASKTVSPKMFVTRAQAAKMFEKFLRDCFYGDCEHDFAEPTYCTHGVYCTKCHMYGEGPTGHMGYGLTCTTSAKCIFCGQNIEPGDVPHTFEKATCTSPMTCIYCGATHGKALGHLYVSNSDGFECSRCGYSVEVP